VPCDVLCCAFQFVLSDYGIRVQKIGCSYRVLKKVWTGANWRSQFGGADLQEIPLTPRFQRWADECAKVYGGIELLAVDALHVGKGSIAATDGAERTGSAAVTGPSAATGDRVVGSEYADSGGFVILELNTTAIGLQPRHWTQDSTVVRDLALQRLDTLIVRKQPTGIDTPLSALNGAVAADVKAAIDNKVRRPTPTHPSPAHSVPTRCSVCAVVRCAVLFLRVVVQMDVPLSEAQFRNKLAAAEARALEQQLRGDRLQKALIAANSKLETVGVGAGTIGWVQLTAAVIVAIVVIVLTAVR
jgi:hypothetical protein